tara:strand:+ start:3324 stop:3461 length:138 start_codon:yes stop_codon:yes gene_type:complete
MLIVNDDDVFEIGDIILLLVIKMNENGLRLRLILIVNDDDVFGIG